MSDADEKDSDGDGGVDEDRAHGLAQELVQHKESSSGQSSKRKEDQAKLLEWMLENDRAEIDVGGVGTAAVHYTTQSLKATDLLVTTLQQEPYNWPEAKVEDLLLLVADTKERLAETKPVLKIKLLKRKRKSAKGSLGAKSRKKSSPENDNGNAEQDALLNELGVSNPYQDPNYVAVVDEPDTIVVDQKDQKHAPNTAPNTDATDVAGRAPPTVVEKKKRKKKISIVKDSISIGNLVQETRPGVYGVEMDVEDIINGRSKPDHQFTDVLGPIRL